MHSALGTSASDLTLGGVGTAFETYALTLVK